MPELHHYRAYGLHVASEVELPAFAPAQAGSHDLYVRYQHGGGSATRGRRGRTVYRSRETIRAGIPYLRVVVPDDLRSSPWVVRHTGATGTLDFVLHDAGRSVTIRACGQVAAADLQAYFGGTVMGHVLRMRGLTCLHGGVLAWRGGAVAIVGPKGAGKSSLTAAWARHGHPVLADDVGILQPYASGTWMVPPAYPHLRLWPATLKALFEAGLPGASPVMSFADKSYLDLTVPPFRFASTAQPLRCVLVLTPRGGKTPDVTRLAAGPALVALLAHVYAPHAGGVEARARDLSLLTNVCLSKPVLRVTLPDDVAWLRTGSKELLEALPD